jgi:hypothetical protein
VCNSGMGKVDVSRVFELRIELCFMDLFQDVEAEYSDSTAWKWHLVL